VPLIWTGTAADVRARFSELADANGLIWLPPEEAA
jgi:hypothetical protein